MNDMQGYGETIMARIPEILGGEPERAPTELMDMQSKIRATTEEVREEIARFDDPPPEGPHTVGLRDPGRDTANTVYILYLVNLVVPFLGIVGVIMVYNARPSASDAARTHLDNQIRIFWTTVIGTLISIVLLVILIGFLTSMLLVVWKIVRVATGLSLLSRGAPVRNVESFNFVSE